MEETINAFISQQLVTNPELLPIWNDTSLMDSHILDSVAFLDLVMYLEEQFGIRVDDAELTRDNFETIDAICAYVRAKQTVQVEA